MPAGLIASRQPPPASFACAFFFFFRTALTVLLAGFTASQPLTSAGKLPQFFHSLAGLGLGRGKWAGGRNIRPPGLQGDNHHSHSLACETIVFSYLGFFL